MNYNQEKFEKVIAEVLALMEKGKSASEILNLYPDHRDDLRSVFNALDFISKAKDGVVAPKEILSRILSELPAASSVTNEEVARYPYVDGKGRQNKPNQIHYPMLFNWKMLVPAGIVIALVAIFVASRFGSQTEQVAIQESGANQITALPAATGNVDDAVAAVLDDSSNESILLASADKDVSSVISDSQMISDFGQSYDENAL